MSRLFNDPERALPAKPGYGIWAMWIFLASLTMLFAASIVGFLMIRFNAPQWPPAGVPEFSAPGLMASTLVLLISSGTMHWALTGVRGGNQSALRWGLVATLLLGLAFLVLQAFNWQPVISALYPAREASYKLTWVLAALHGAHVVGGLVPLIYIWWRARRGLYSRSYHPGVSYMAMYWHFLDVVWLVLFAVLVTLA